MKKTMTPFHKTIIHQELEKWLEKPEEGRFGVSQDDGNSFVIESNGRQWVIVDIETNHPVNIVDHDLSVGNENTEVV